MEILKQWEGGLRDRIGHHPPTSEFSLLGNNGGGEGRGGEEMEGANELIVRALEFFQHLFDFYIGFSVKTHDYFNPKSTQSLRSITGMRLATAICSVCLIEELNT